MIKTGHARMHGCWGAELTRVHSATSRATLARHDILNANINIHLIVMQLMQA